MRTKLSRSLLAGLVSVAFAAPASAAVVVNFVETGAGVFGSISGSLSLTGLSLLGTWPKSAGVLPSEGVLSTSGTADAYFGIFSPVPYGTSNSWSNPTASSGNGLGMSSLGGGQGILSVPNGYAAGDALTGSLDFTGSTLATLGMTPGSYVTALSGGDSFTINVTAVPEPSAYALMLASLGALGLVARRQRG